MFYSHLQVYFYVFFCYCLFTEYLIIKYDSDVIICVSVYLNYSLKLVSTLLVELP